MPGGLPNFVADIPEDGGFEEPEEFVDVYDQVSENPTNVEEETQGYQTANDDFENTELQPDTLSQVEDATSEQDISEAPLEDTEASIAIEQLLPTKASLEKTPLTPEQQITNLSNSYNQLLEQSQNIFKGQIPEEVAANLTESRDYLGSISSMQKRIANTEPGPKLDMLLEILEDDITSCEASIESTSQQIPGEPLENEAVTQEEQKIDVAGDEEDTDPFTVEVHAEKQINIAETFVLQESKEIEDDYNTARDNYKSTYQNTYVRITQEKGILKNMFTSKSTIREMILQDKEVIQATEKYRQSKVPALRARTIEQTMASNPDIKKVLTENPELNIKDMKLQEISALTENPNAFKESLASESINQIIEDVKITGIKPRGEPWTHF